MPEEENKEPGTYVEQGASQEVLEDPEVVQEISRIFGQPIDATQVAEASDFEKAINAYINDLNAGEASLNKRESAYLDKIENRDLTSSEQLSMAIALVAPAILGAIFGGKEGALAGLAGGAGAVTQGLENRDKEIKEAEKMIPEIVMERAKIGKQKIEAHREKENQIQSKSDALTDPKLRDMFNRDGEIINGKLVLNTGNPLLPLKSTKVRSVDDVKQFKEKEMPALEKDVTDLQDANFLLTEMNKLIETVQESEKKGLGGLGRNYIPFYDTAARGFKSLIPVSRDSFEDENGNKITYSQLYDSYHEGLKDQYLRIFKGGAGTKHRQESFFRENPNPFSTKAFISGKGQWEQAKKQNEILEKRLNNHVIDNLEVKGIETTPVKEYLKSKNANPAKAEANKKKERANAAVQQVLGKMENNGKFQNQS